MRFIRVKKNTLQIFTIGTNIRNAPLLYRTIKECEITMAMPLKHDNDNPVKKTSHRRLVTAIVLTAVATAFSGMAVVGQEMLRNDPARPSRLMARDLHITQQQFVSCFNHTNPAPAGSPSTDRKPEDKTALLSCLQVANAAITHDRLDWVMDRYWPGGHAAR